MPIGKDGEEYIDCTPTWQGLLPVMLELVRNPKAKVREPMVEEFCRMAKAADAYNEAVKGGRLK